MANEPTLNDKVALQVQDALCYIPVGMLMEFARIRPVQNAGVVKLTEMISRAGYAQGSVIKVRAPASRAHLHWGISYRVRQAAEGGQQITKKEWKEMV